MKILNFVITASSNKIATSITEAFIDPLETKNRALEVVQKTPAFKELNARIAAYQDYVKKLKKDGVKFADLKSIPEHIKVEVKTKLGKIKESQGLLNDMHKKEMEDSPVFLLPNHAFLVSDKQPEELLNLINDSDVFVKIIEADIEAVMYEVIPDNLGKKYRLPDSQFWLIVTEPDHLIPGNAVFEDPEPAEIERIESVRVSGLTKVEKYDEAVSMRDHAERAYLDELILAEVKDKEEDITAYKKAAKQRLKQCYKDIDKKYSLTL